MPQTSAVSLHVRGRQRFGGGAWAGWRPIGLLALLVWCAAVGCQTDGSNDLRRRITDLEAQLREKDNRLVAQQEVIDQLHEQLKVARSISEEDLKRVFYPEKIVIDKLSGGADYDRLPGDDGVTVYLRPVDRWGDTIKVAGDIRIQLFDLAAGASENLLGEYHVSVDEVGELWHGALLTDHYTIKCPWPHGPPKHREVTIRATFVDYLTKRVLTAQRTCEVDLPPK